jgi:hypothetical protein
MMPNVNMEGAGGHSRYAGRQPSAVHTSKLRRALVGLLLGLVVLLAGVLPVAGANLSGDPPNSLNGLEATYNVTASIKWKKRRLNVNSTAVVTNNSDTAVDALTFNLAPAKIGDAILGDVTVDGTLATATIQDQNVVVTLPTPLAPTAQASVTIVYAAWFGSTSGNKQWLFAKVENIATAYRWIPWLSRAYSFVTPTYGEPFVTKVSDEVQVSITPDRAMEIATTGHQTGVDGLTHTFVAHNVRDFNFAASPRYVKHTQTSGDTTVTYYTVELPLLKLQKWTLAAFERFDQKVGPYPYNDYTVAEVPTGPSMESPGMIWMTQQAVAKGTLKYLAVHETGHQWFYGAVGNDQAAEPFADEAMTEFLTRDFIGHRASHCSQDMLDKRVYNYSAACYYEVVYVQGDNYLEAYRQQVGNDLFWQGVRRYFNDYEYKLGGTRKLWDTLDQVSGFNGGHADRFPMLYP